MSVLRNSGGMERWESICHNENFPGLCLLSSFLFSDPRQNSFHAQQLLQKFLVRVFVRLLGTLFKIIKFVLVYLPMYRHCLNNSRWAFNFPCSASDASKPERQTISNGPKPLVRSFLKGNLDNYSQLTRYRALELPFGSNTTCGGSAPLKQLSLCISSWVSMLRG